LINPNQLEHFTET